MNTPSSLRNLEITLVFTPIKIFSFFHEFMQNGYYKPVFLIGRSPDRQRSMSTFLPVRPSKFQYYSIPQSENGLFIITHLALGAQYFYPSANKQAYTVRTADSVSFVFHVKKNPKKRRR